MELVKINASEYGLEENKAKEIEAQFKPMLAKMTELEIEYNKIIKLEINGETCAKAKELRLRYVKVRTGTDVIHKKQKAFYLSGGRFCDGWKNAQRFASEACEDTLMAIEKHYENIERDRIEKLQQERQAEVCKYEGEMIVPTLGIMDDDIWTNYINGVKLNHDHKIAAEKKAEEERIETERINKLHTERKESVLHLWQFMPDENMSVNFGEWDSDMWNELVNYLKLSKSDYDNEQEQIRKENIRLEKEAAEKLRIEKELKIIREKRNKELRPYIVFIREYNILLNKGEKEYQKEFKEIKIGAEQQWEYDIKENKRKLDQEEKDRVERDKLKAKIEAKEEAERKEKQRLLDEKQKELKAKKDAQLAPDKDKLTILAKGLSEFPLPELDSNEANEILSNIATLIQKTVTYIEEKAKSL